jgi:vacuolar-type H+-ATPase subunit E/Vma4
MNSAENQQEAVENIIDEAEKYIKNFNFNWYCYMDFRKQISAVVKTTDEYDTAIIKLCKVLGI